MCNVIQILWICVFICVWIVPSRVNYFSIYFAHFLLVSGDLYFSKISQICNICFKYFIPVSHVPVNILWDFSNFKDFKRDNSLLIFLTAKAFLWLKKISNLTRVGHESGVVFTTFLNSKRWMPLDSAVRQKVWNSGASKAYG